GRMRALLAAIQTSQMAGHRVLEVAAGDGSLATGLAAQGREVYANDLRAEHLQAALSQLQDGAKVKVIAGDVFAADPASLGRFDLVVACEVIEHVAHPDQFLAKLRALLSPDGLLFLTTPNGRYFRNRLPNFSDVGDAGKLEEFQFRPDANGHLFLLTANELAGMAGQAGLTPIDLHYSGSPFVTGHAGFRLLRKLHLRRPFLAAENA